MFGFVGRNVVLYPKFGARFRRCYCIHFPSYPSPTLFPLRQIQRGAEQAIFVSSLFFFFFSTFDLKIQEKKVIESSWSLGDNSTTKGKRTMEPYATLRSVGGRNALLLVVPGDVDRVSGLLGERTHTAPHRERDLH